MYSSSKDNALLCPLGAFLSNVAVVDKSINKVFDYAKASFVTCFRMVPLTLFTNAFFHIDLQQRQQT